MSATEKYRQSNRAKGLCLDCPKPVWKHERCEFHHREHLRHNRNYQARICGGCSQEGQECQKVQWVKGPNNWLFKKPVATMAELVGNLI